MTTKMKAPKGVTGEALIEGHTYTIGKDGVIVVAQEGHIDTLRRHGFEDYFDEEVDIDELDTDDLVTFIEERGGTADSSMSLKKLRKLAHEVA